MLKVKTIDLFDITTFEASPYVVAGFPKSYILQSNGADCIAILVDGNAVQVPVRQGFDAAAGYSGHT